MTRQSYEERRAKIYAWRTANRDRVRAIKRRYYTSAKGKACKKKEDIAYVISGGRAKAEAKRAEKPISPARLAARKKWARKHPEYSAQDRAMRRSRSKMITNPAEKLEVDGLFLFCRIFSGFEVDHIIPLKHKRVSGLHVLPNLQVLSISENRRKGNRFPYHKET